MYKRRMGESETKIDNGWRQIAVRSDTLSRLRRIQEDEDFPSLNALLLEMADRWSERL